MSTIPDKRLVVWEIARCLAMVLAVSLPWVTDAAAQTDSSRRPDHLEAVDAALDSVQENSVRAATAEARRHLASALGAEDGTLRWTALRAVGALSEPWIAEIVLPLCDSPDVTERVLAMEVIANTDPGVGKAVFLEALTSGERSLRLRGLLGLAAVDDGDTVPSLVTIMNEDPDPDLQAVAARALGDIGDIRASVPLYEAIESGHPPVREQAVLALLALGDDGIGEYLINRLKENKDPGEREILRLLALIPDLTLIERIEPYLKHNDDAVRTLAATAIFSILERSGAARP